MEIWIVNPPFQSLPDNVEWRGRGLNAYPFQSELSKTGTALDMTGADAPHDMHRQIHRLIESEAVTEDIKKFQAMFGSFFDPNQPIHSKKQTVGDVLTEWHDIAAAVNAIDSGSGRELLEVDDNKRVTRLAEKLNLYCEIELAFKSARAPNPSTSIRPLNLAGWCWAMIAREVVDDIFYRPCSENCGRLIPSLTPKGKRIHNCSVSCRRKERRRFEKLARSAPELQNLSQSVMRSVVESLEPVQEQMNEQMAETNKKIQAALGPDFKKMQKVLREVRQKMGGDDA